MINFVDRLIVVINGSLKTSRSLLVQLVLSMAQHSHPFLTLSFSVPNLPYSLVSKVFPIFVSFSILHHHISLSLSLVKKRFFFVLHSSNILKFSGPLMMFLYYIISGLLLRLIMPSFPKVSFLIHNKETAPETISLYCLSVVECLNICYFFCFIRFS
jgi:hypothetical protein